MAKNPFPRKVVKAILKNKKNLKRLERKIYDTNMGQKRRFERLENHLEIGPPTFEEFMRDRLTQTGGMIFTGSPKIEEPSDLVVDRGVEWKTAEELGIKQWPEAETIEPKKEENKSTAITHVMLKDENGEVFEMDLRQFRRGIINQTINEIGSKDHTRRWLGFDTVEQLKRRRFENNLSEQSWLTDEEKDERRERFDKMLETERRLSNGDEES